MTFRDPYIGRIKAPMPRLIKPYKYQKERPIAKENLQRITHRQEDEELSGFVHGKPASDLEERFARSLDKKNQNFIFEFPVDTAYTLPEEEKMVDFIILTPIPQPVELDGIFIHKNAEKKYEDQLRDIQINEILEKQGYKPLLRITGDPIPLPEDQEISDEIVEKLL